MEFVVVAFRSRVHTLKVFEIIKSFGVDAEIVNTPKEAGVGCGLSVKISKNAVDGVKKLVARLSLSSFAGFFLVKVTSNGRVVVTI
jgi:hypothetical protein